MIECTCWGARRLRQLFRSAVASQIGQSATLYNEWSLAYNHWQPYLIGVMVADLIDMELFADALDKHLIRDNMMRLEGVANSVRVIHIGG